MTEKKLKEDLESDVKIFLAVASTGLMQPDFDPEICQITLTKQDGTKLFSKYVLPQRSFQKGTYSTILLLYYYNINTKYY